MERFRREAKELGIAAVVNIYERASPGEYYDTSVVIDTDGRLLGISRMMHILLVGREHWISRFRPRACEGRDSHLLR